MSNNFSIKNVSKAYGKKNVLCEASAELPYGEIIGLLGLNGAGKTTLFNCITGLLPYKGETDKTSRPIAYMAKTNFFQGSDSIDDAIEWYDVLFDDFDKEEAKRRFAECGFEFRSKINGLSLGQRSVADFILTVSRDAEVYLFDEPFANLDPQMRDFMKREIICSMDENRLFVLSTHDIEELDAVFSKIVLLDKGKLSEVYDAEEIRANGESLSEFFLRKTSLRPIGQGGI